MWVRPHQFKFCLKHSTGVDSTNEGDFFKELEHEVGMGATDTLDER